MQIEKVEVAADIHNSFYFISGSTQGQSNAAKPKAVKVPSWSDDEVDDWEPEVKAAAKSPLPEEKKPWLREPQPSAAAAAVPASRPGSLTRPQLLASLGVGRGIGRGVVATEPPTGE